MKQSPPPSRRPTKTPPREVSYGNYFCGRESLNRAEKDVLATFRRYLMTPNRILCFYGPQLEQSQDALRSLTEMELLVKESFKGAYSLTTTGYAAMNDCHEGASR